VFFLRKLRNVLRGLTGKRKYRSTSGNCSVRSIREKKTGGDEDSAEEGASSSAERGGGNVFLHEREKGKLVEQGANVGRRGKLPGRAAMKEFKTRGTGWTCERQHLSAETEERLGGAGSTSVRRGGKQRR